MKMETKKEVFARYKDEYYKAKVAKGGRKTLTKIIDTVESNNVQHRMSNIAFIYKYRAGRYLKTKLHLRRRK